MSSDKHPCQWCCLEDAGVLWQQAKQERALLPRVMSDPMESNLLGRAGGSFGATSACAGQVFVHVEGNLGTGGSSQTQLV